MNRLVIVLMMSGLVAGCDGWRAPDPAVPSPPATATATSTPTPAATTAPSNGARNVSEDTDDFQFEYSYPAQAGNLPGLAAVLDRRMERSRAEIARMAEEARRDARSNGFPYNKYSREMAWKLVSDLPNWLSLSGEMSEYTGGAHGNYGVASLVWDKRKGDAMEGIELFQSPDALQQAVSDAYCAALDREREKRRGEPVDQTTDDLFSNCPPMKDLVVLLGSGRGKVFDRMTLYAGPYVAGAYVEGAYEVNLPVTAAVIEAVKPQFRDSFAVGR